MIIGLLFSIANASNHTQSLSLSNQKCMTEPTLTNLHPDQYSQEFHYYPFAINTLINLSNKLCAPNNTEDLNCSVFNMITGINKSKILTKHISCECKCKFDGRKCN